MKQGYRYAFRSFPIPPPPNCPCFLYKWFYCSFFPLLFLFGSFFIMKDTKKAKRNAFLLWFWLILAPFCDHSNFYFFDCNLLSPFAKLLCKKELWRHLVFHFFFRLSLLQMPVSLLNFMVAATASSSYVTHTLVTNPLEKTHHTWR